MQLIALDIDGTLYNDKREIASRTKEALMKAQKKGCILVLASGRPTSGLFRIAEQLDMKKYHGLLLAYNGGKVVNYSNGNTLYENTIPLSVTNKLLRHLEKYPVTPIIDDGYYIYTDNADGFQIAYESSSNQLGVKVVTNICDAVKFSVAKILVAAPENILARNMEDIIAPFTESLSFVLSAPIYLEATPIGINKEISLQKVCKKLEMSKEDVIAFGDAQNDISMIRFAGMGIAMGNACDSLKEIADMITYTNNDDGIAIALEKLGI